MQLMLRQQELRPSPSFAYDTASATQVLEHAILASVDILTLWDYEHDKLFLQTESEIISSSETLEYIDLKDNSSIWLMLEPLERAEVDSHTSGVCQIEDLTLESSPSVSLECYSFDNPGTVILSNRVPRFISSCSPQPNPPPPDTRSDTEKPLPHSGSGAFPEFLSLFRRKKAPPKVAKNYNNTFQRHYSVPKPSDTAISVAGDDDSTRVKIHGS